MTQLWQFEAVAPRTAIDRAAALLGNADPSPALAVSVFEVEGVPNIRRLEALFDHAPDMDAILAFAQLSPEDGQITCAPLPDQDWVQKSLQDLTPVRAGRFVVHGSHHPKSPGGTVNVLIDAGAAFGTGHHATTWGCLMAMDTLFKHTPPRTMLDVGTGTGVLAIAAAKAAQTRVDATDIDPVSVEFAQAAARANGVADRISLHCSATLSPVRENRYPLVAANILAGPLITLAPQIARAVAPAGTLILSGLLAHQARSVFAAYRARGLVANRKILQDNWATLVLTRR